MEKASKHEVLKDSTFLIEMVRNNEMKIN
jgi:hypothetical protein